MIWATILCLPYISFGKQIINGKDFEISQKCIAIVVDMKMCKESKLRKDGRKSHKSDLIIGYVLTVTTKHLSLCLLFARDVKPNHPMAH